MQVTVHGYRYSVYTHALRMGLAEKSVPYDIKWVDPFTPEPDPVLARLHPFGRVPVLSHGDFTIYETAAILRYVDQTFSGPALTPENPKATARMAQIIAITDNYAYWPLVRQVFAHRAFRPAAGETADQAQVQMGLDAAPAILTALEQIAAEGFVLNQDVTTLADIHLAPMIGSFVQAPEGAKILKTYPVLATWWSKICKRSSYQETAPGLPELSK